MKNIWKCFSVFLIQSLVRRISLLFVALFIMTSCYIPMPVLDFSEIGSGEIGDFFKNNPRFFSKLSSNGKVVYSNLNIPEDLYNLNKIISSEVDTYLIDKRVEKLEKKLGVKCKDINSLKMCVFNSRILVNNKGVPEQRKGKGEKIEVRIMINEFSYMIYYEFSVIPSN